jgi:hypothetical protein
MRHIYVSVTEPSKLVGFINLMYRTLSCEQMKVFLIAQCLYGAIGILGLLLLSITTSGFSLGKSILARVVTLKNAALVGVLPILLVLLHVERGRVAVGVMQEDLGTTPLLVRRRVGVAGVVKRP